HDQSDKSDKAIIDELHERLAVKTIELENATNSFRTVLGLKNQKIREMEERISLLIATKQEEMNNAITDQMKIMQTKLDNMESTLNIRALSDKSTTNSRPIMEIVQPTRDVTPIVDNGVTSGIIRAKFTEISKLTKSHVQSEAIKVAGLDWVIRIYQTTREDTKYLSAFLAIITKPFPEARSFSVYFKIKLVRQSSCEAPFVREHNGVKFDTSKGYGNNKFFKFEELLSTSNDYVTRSIWRLISQFIPQSNFVIFDFLSFDYKYLLLLL
ncbi:hypothetical protein PMAYCL1PPCAC_24692, partial [Pristionchus mayeri]